MMTTRQGRDMDTTKTATNQRIQTRNTKRRQPLELRNGKHNSFRNCSVPYQRRTAVTCKGVVGKASEKRKTQTGQLATKLKFDLAVGCYIHKILSVYLGLQRGKVDVLPAGHKLVTLTNSDLLFDIRHLRLMWSVDDEIQMTTQTGLHDKVCSRHW